MPRCWLQIIEIIKDKSGASVVNVLPSESDGSVLDEDSDSFDL
jgi:hypothetical protein